MANFNIGVYRKEDALAPDVDGYDETLRAGEDNHFFTKILSSRYKRGLDIEVATVDVPHYLYYLHPSESDNLTNRTYDFSGIVRKTVEDALPLFQELYGEDDIDTLTQRVCDHKAELIARTREMSDSEKHEILTEQKSVPFPTNRGTNFCA